MNPEDIKNLNKQSQLHFACEAFAKCSPRSKPQTYVCVKCGKCYHQQCIIKKKGVFHIIGHLISCCTKQPKYLEQQVETLTAELNKQKIPFLFSL